MEEKFVYIVFVNSDMTEGRGPKNVHSVWDCFESAAEFIDNQPGVMGRKAKWSTEKYGDWEIKKYPVFLDNFSFETFNRNKLVKNALAKLTKEEIKALGLEESN